MSAQTINTSSNAIATAYAPNVLVAVASTGDVFVLWFDGSNIKYSYAQSPYSSWTTTTLVSSIGGGPRWQAGLNYNPSDDSLVAVVSNASGNMVAYVFTYASHAWTPGSANTVLASSGSFNGGAVPMCRDAQGRIWAAWANNSHVIQVRYSSDGGVTWTASTTATQVGGGADFVIGLAYIGNYVVLTYVDSTVTYVYQRIDAHLASLGSWSAKADTGSGVDNGANAISLRGAPGSVYGVLVNDEGASIPSRVYNSTTDTWSATTTLGASASDRDPTLATDGTDLYALWCAFSAANNYALVYKKWTASTQTWDASATTLEAAGSNIQWPNAAASASLLAFIFAVGTANPWTVKLDTLSLGGGGSTVNGIGVSSGQGQNTASATIATPAVGQGQGQATAKASIATPAQSTGVGQATGQATTATPATSSGVGQATGRASLAAQATSDGVGSGQGQTTLFVRGESAGQGQSQAQVSTGISGRGESVGVGQGEAHASLFATALSAGVGSAQAAATLLITAAISAGRASDVEQAGALIQPAGAVSAGIGQSEARMLPTLVPGTVILGDRARNSVTLTDRTLASVTLSDRASGRVTLTDRRAE